MGCVAVLDHGKSNTRMVVFDAEGRQRAERTRPTPTDATGPYPAEDVEALIPFVVDALAEFAQRFDIATIIPVAHGAAGALVDADGLVRPVIDYEHSATPDLNAAYDAVRPEFAETGSPPLPAMLNLGRQLFMLADAHSDAVAQASAFLALPQYWAWVLSGEMASEITSLGAHTDLWDPWNGRPSTLVARQGWARLIPPLRRAGDALGPLRPEIAAATGLGRHTQVLTGLHDSNASLVPYLSAGADPVAVVSSGTWAIIMNIGGDTARLDPAADMLANVDVLGRPTPSARFMGGREHALISGDDQPGTLAAAEAVLEAGTLALPSFSDQGGPWAHSKGQIIGDVPQIPGARSALAALYCALVSDDILSRLGASGPVQVDGPFAKNPVWLAAMAGLRPEGIVPRDGASPAAGAAMLARARERARSQPAPPPPRPYAQKLDLARYRSLWQTALAQHLS
ncbi:MAG: FGGY family carbohydrate kinase [Pseudomonadota bacterium]